MKEKYLKYRKEVHAAALWLSEHGYFGSLRGSGGNVSVRIDSENSMAITPSGVRYTDMTDGDIFVVGFDLELLEGRQGLKASMESEMHSAIYRKRPEVKAVVHTHQTYGSVFSVINMPIPALFDEVALSLGTLIEVAPYAFSGTSELARNVEAVLSGGANACIIQNHGIVALGASLDQAVLNAELLEKTAKIYHLALSSGKRLTTLPAEAIDIIEMIRKPADAQ
ncbi:MAG: class II aldolase/adducin family protein [Smithella sp.]|jgi:L-fuculose-phosphate aldolase|nr:class II aldolase/adducin family protein [Smithella sp.]